MALETERLAQLVARRQASGYSQTEIANAIDVAPSTVACWEGGHRPIPQHRVPEYAAALDALDERKRIRDRVLRGSSVASGT